MNDLVNNLWAKTSPYRSLISHMIDTGKCAQSLLQLSPMAPVSDLLCSCLELPKESMIATVGFIAAMHDIGKCHPLFQAKDMRMPVCSELLECGMMHHDLRKDDISGFRHEKYTESVMRRMYVELAENDFWDAVFCALSLHHQGKNGGNSCKIPSSCKESTWEELQNEINERLTEHFAPVLCTDMIHLEEADAAVQMIMGITILSDWIASDYHPDEINEEEVLIRRGLYMSGMMPDDEDFCKIWSGFDRNHLRGVQKAAEQLGKNPSCMYIIEAPMGEGKTEAALYLAARQCSLFGKSGFYMALPTAATGNQMYHRVQYWFSQNNTGKARLLHSTAWMIEDCTPVGEIEVSSGDREKDDTVSQWFSPLRMGLLSQYAVGTVDQAMMSVLNVKYGILRLLGLSGKVLIIDEIHAYDTYMQTIIERLLSWCRALSVPVILLSATLPRHKKSSLITSYLSKDQLSLSDMELSEDYPLITYIDGHDSIQHHSVGEVYMHRSFAIETVPFFDDAEKTADLAISLSENGGCICVLLNTVKKAQAVFSYLNKKVSDTDLMLFHARFPAGTRQKIEEKCISLFGKNQTKRPKKAILVSTQVMEQSIDADFDAMITDLAPIDFLLQRMGRVHRFEDTVRPSDKVKPKVYILTSESGYSGQLVYAPLIMERTQTLVLSREVIHSPNQIRECVEQVYSEKIPDEEKQFDLWAKQQFKAQLDSAKAEGVLMDAPNYNYPSLCERIPNLFDGDEDSLLAAKTRLGEESTRIIMLQRDELDNLLDYPDKKKAKELLLRSVAIRTSHLGDIPLEAVKGKGMLKGFVLLPQTDGKSRWNDWIIIDDPVLGIIIQKDE